MPTEAKTEITVTCDFCGRTLKWIDQEVQAHAEALPEAAWSILKIQRFAPYDDKDSGVYVFCDAKCARAFLHQNTFKPTPSPQQRARLTQGVTAKAWEGRQESGVRSQESEAGGQKQVVLDAPPPEAETK